MKRYHLDGLTKDNKWQKYCEFLNLNNSDVFIANLIKSNHILPYTHYRIVEVISISKIMSIHEI
jgi:hypothetical protein